MSTTNTSNDRSRVIALATNLSEIVELLHVGLKQGLDLDLVAEITEARIRLLAENPLNANIIGWSEDEFQIARNVVEGRMIVDEELDPQ